MQSVSRTPYPYWTAFVGFGLMLIGVIAIVFAFTT
jgi:hypothetical protein